MSQRLLTFEKHFSFLSVLIEFLKSIMHIDDIALSMHFSNTKWLVAWFELMVLSTLCCLPQKKKYVQSIIKAEFLMPHIVSVSKMMTDGFFRAHTISFNDLLQTFLTSLDDGVIYPKNRELMILSSAHKYRGFSYSDCCKNAGQ